MNTRIGSKKLSCFLQSFFLAILLVCFFDTGTLAQVSIEPAFPQLGFNQPVDFQFADDQSNLVYVVERRGIIHRFENREDVSTTDIVLDISSRVSTRGEGGLLGLAFHPDFPDSSEAFVYYTTDLPFRTIVARFEVVPGTGQFDVTSEEIILTLDQPFSNHNGGQVRFGPDGFLYISLGDGGGAGDPLENGQDRTTLFGTILRIDIDQTQGSMNYAIPPDNPFAGNNQGLREEIFAYGLRNPFRFSFDADNGRLWAGDVGQNRVEEIDIISSGANYGWNIMEGTLCFEPSSNCNQNGLTLPVFEYPREDGQSVTGGFVYRGSRITELRGAYVYGDFITGTVWSFRFENGQISNQQVLGELGQAGVAAFGEDQQRELYICSFDGGIYTLRPEQATPIDLPRELPETITLHPNFPNPFNPSTTITFSLPQSASVRLAVYDISGRKVSTLLNRTMSAGQHSVTFNADEVSSGIYFYTLQAGEQRLTQSMTLIK